MINFNDPPYMEKKTAVYDIGKKDPHISLTRRLPQGPPTKRRQTAAAIFCKISFLYLVKSYPCRICGNTALKVKIQKAADTRKGQYTP